MAAPHLLAAVTASCLLLLCTAGRLAQFTYVGCFVDFTGQVRDLDGLKGIKQMNSYPTDSDGVASSSSMSLQYCSSICSLGGFPYFGVELGSYCFCGNSYGSQGAASESKCNTACTGNPSQICGGSGCNSVFSQTYPNPKMFKEAVRADLIVSDTYSQKTHWTITVGNVLECAVRCNASCQAVIFSQQQRLCHLLRFALVPSALSSFAGDFYVRV